jgi:hypothetical protein
MTAPMTVSMTVSDTLQVLALQVSNNRVRNLQRV